MNLFPTTIVDDFFNNPEEVRQLALSQTFSKTGPNYPGLRSSPLHEVNKDLFDFFCIKLFSQWYEIGKSPLNWNVSAYFQIIKFDKEKPENNLVYIHTDTRGVLGGVVYLNKEEREQGGTTLYSYNGDDENEKRHLQGVIDLEARHNIFSSPETVSKEQKERVNFRNNKDFTPSVTVGSKFNRMVCFGSEVWHAQTSYGGWEKDRLTLAFFVNTFRGVAISSRLQNYKMLQF